jgi:SAM-dependent methyltransferase
VSDSADIQRGNPHRGARRWLKALLRGLVPHAHRAHLRALSNRLSWRFWAGDQVRCNCCDTRFRRFRLYVGDDGHRALACPRCGALGRHRVDWLFLGRETDLLARGGRLLHIAPEVCLAAPLRALEGVDYLSGDYDSSLAMEHLDVTAIAHPDGAFDAIVCNHVLQLVEDDRAALRELFRVLAPGGWALLQSAVDERREQTVEERQPAAERARGRRYREVFMRLYGRDYATRLREAGFELIVSRFARELPEEERRGLGLDEDETIYLARRPLASGPRPGQAVAE